MHEYIIITVQSNYNFTHALYPTRVAHVFQRGPRNNHACTYKFTRLQNTCDSYTSHSHACAICFACESRLVTQFYKSNVTSALVAG